MNQDIEREAATTTTDSTVQSPVVRSSRVATVRAGVRARIEKLGLAHSPIMIGAAELAGFTVALLLAVAAIGSYFYMLAPAKRSLQEAESNKASQQRKLTQSDVTLEGGTPQATVPEIVESVRRFEQAYLPLQTEGRTAVIIELNEAVARNNLRNAGYDFTTLDALTDATQGSGRKVVSDAQLQSAFPGFGITLSVVGTYQNLRRFIRDIEASGQFIVVNSVELEGTREAEGGGTLVNLRLRMAAYFRPDTLPSAEAVTASESIGN